MNQLRNELAAKIYAAQSAHTKGREAYDVDAEQLCEQLAFDAIKRADAFVRILERQDDAVVDLCDMPRPSHIPQGMTPCA